VHALLPLLLRLAATQTRNLQTRLLLMLLLLLLGAHQGKAWQHQ
jgi:hypothetical protein